MKWGDYVGDGVILVLVVFSIVSPMVSEWKQGYKCIKYQPTKDVQCNYFVDETCYYNCSSMFLTMEELWDNCKLSNTYCAERVKIEILKDGR